MIDRKLARKVVFGVVMLGTVMAPAIAMAQEAAAATGEKGPWQVGVAKAIAAGVTMMFSTMSAGYAQAKIGAAGAGTLAERPEVAVMIIVLQALPEIIVLLGFVIAFMIGTGAY
jgi:V/A-type H+-transporting ATPase subunit K